MAQRRGRGKEMETTWNTTSFYFTNFPNSYGAKDLTSIFQGWGSVEDVIIAHKLNKYGARYGFVKFANVKNVRRLMSELSTICIGTMKLYVNLPWFNKEVVKESQRTNKPRQNQRTSPNANITHEQPGAPRFAKNRTTSSRTGKGNHQPRRTERVNPIQPKVKEIWRIKQTKTEPTRGTITTTIRGVEWMEVCMVGRTHSELCPDDVANSLVKMGLGSIRSRFMGDDMHLLSVPDGVNFRELISNNLQSLEEVFQLIVPWDPKTYAGNKSVWIQIRGLPHIFWNEECFKIVVGSFGTLIEVDNSTILWDRLEYARVKVRTQNATVISFVENFEINGTACTVVMQEELGEHCRNQYSGWSSESISSESTWPEDPESNEFGDQNDEVDEAETYESESYNERKMGFGADKRSVGHQSSKTLDGYNESSHGAGGDERVVHENGNVLEEKMGQLSGGSRAASVQICTEKTNPQRLDVTPSQKNGMWALARKAGPVLKEWPAPSPPYEAYGTRGSASHSHVADTHQDMGKPKLRHSMGQGQVRSELMDSQGRTTIPNSV